MTLGCDYGDLRDEANQGSKAIQLGKRESEWGWHDFVVSEGYNTVMVGSVTGF